MKPAQFFFMAALLAAMTLTLSACRPAKTKPKEDEGEITTAGPGDGGPTKKTAIKAGSGTIKGKFVYSSAPPPFTKLALIEGKEECRNCPVPKDKLYWDCDQNWILGKDKAVANVLVRIKVPANHYFLPAEADRTRQDTVVDQPCCAYEPHVFVVYPSYFDGTKQVPTGQELLMKNSASFNHNTKIGGDNRAGNLTDKTIPPGQHERFMLKYQPKSEVDVECAVHGWMKAKLFIVDHPYAVVTNLDGTFELKNVPNDTKLTVEFWHENMTPITKEITLSANEVKDFGTEVIGPK